MPTGKRPKAQLPDDLRRRLDEAHRGILRVHKALLDHQRVRYERERGKIDGAVAFLQVVIQDPSFAWLRALSELAVQIDEFVESKTPVEPAEGEALLIQTQKLLEPAEGGDGFQREYFRAIQESPQVATAHGEWKRALTRPHPFTDPN